MDFEDFNGNDSFDSDAVDEELEHQLYGAIFFANSPTPLPEPDSKSSTLNCQQPLTLPQLSTVSLQHEQKNHEEYKMEKKFQLSDVSTSNSVGNALVSSFKDQSSSECDEAFDIADPEITKTDNLSSTEYTTEESECESSSCSNSRRSKLGYSSSRRSSDPVWDSQNLVLGVSHQASSSICNADDSLVIARRLASSSSDPNLWRINNEDRCTNRSKSSRDRYFSDSHNFVCSNCKKRGHLTMDCTNSGPTCILCGEEGHERDRCNRVYCYACFSPGHFKHSCTLLECLKRSICKRCGLQGHQAHLCTELWRQYQNTTEPGKPIPIPRNMERQPGGCCNCGNRGHTVDECRRKPFRSNFLGPPPRRRVLVYDQKDIYKRTKYKSFKASLHNAESDKNINAGRSLVKNKNKDKTKLRKRQQQPKLKTSRVDLPRLSLPEERMTKQKKLKKQKRNPPIPKSEPDLARLEESVHEKLFEQVLTQQNTPAKLSAIPNASENIEVQPALRPQNESTPLGLRRRPSMDGAAFLPLDPNSQATKERQFIPYEHGTHFAQEKRFRRTNNPHLSPFTWINQRTAKAKLNEERVTEESPQFYLGVNSMNRSNSAKYSPQLKSKKKEKKKKKKKNDELDASQEIVSVQSKKKASKRAMLDQDTPNAVRLKSKKVNASTSSLPSPKQARMALQSLLIDSTKPQSSLDAGPSDEHFERNVTMKNNKTLSTGKKKKQNKMGKITKQLKNFKGTKASSNSPRAGSTSQHDWQTFARGPIHIDRWDADGDTRETHCAPHQKQYDRKAVVRTTETTSRTEKQKKKKRKSKMSKIEGIQSEKRKSIAKTAACSQ